MVCITIATTSTVHTGELGVALSRKRTSSANRRASTVHVQSRLRQECAMSDGLSTSSTSYGGV